MNISVVDSLPGTGKTLNAIREINQRTDSGDTETKYLLITPYLKECHRISGVVFIVLPTGEIKPKMNGKDFDYLPYDPKYNCVSTRFKHPLTIGKGGKSEGLLRLITEGKNIVATHTLYQMLSKSIYRQLQSHNYKLIIDESLGVVEKFNGGGFSKKKMEQLWIKEYISVDPDTKKIVWEEATKDDLPCDTLAPIIKNLSDNGNLLMQDNSNIILWTFPIDFLSCFSDVTILTYNFRGSLMDKYLSKHGVTVAISYQENRDEIEREAFSLIRVLDNKKLNAIGSSSYYDLSHTDISKMIENGEIKTLKNNLVNWFNNCNKGQTKSDRAVSIFKDAEYSVRGNGYSRCFLPFNLRAVDGYKDRSTVAYCINLFQDRNIKTFLNMSQEDEDNWSRNELLQWLFRFSIRDKKPLNLYIPSIRMRCLLLNTIPS